MLAHARIASKHYCILPWRFWFLHGGQPCWSRWLVAYWQVDLTEWQAWSGDHCVRLERGVVMLRQGITLTGHARPFTVLCNNRLLVPECHTTRTQVLQPLSLVLILPCGRARVKFFTIGHYWPLRPHKHWDQAGRCETNARNEEVKSI